MKPNPALFAGVIAFAFGAVNCHSAESVPASTAATPPPAIDVPGDPRIEIKPTPLPGALLGKDDATPPPQIDVPGDPVAYDLVTDDLKARLATRRDAWRRSTGSDEFHPSVSVVNGRPILMLMTSSDESAARQSRRLKAAVDACDFMLDDDLFEVATICVATVEKNNPRAVVTRNTEVRRADFRSQVAKSGKKTEYRAALAGSKADDTSLRALCDALDLK